MAESLKEIILENPGLYVSWFGLAIGLIFGFVVFRSNYCSMGSISDIVTFGDYRRFRTWLLAAATAILGAHLVQYLGFTDLSESMYLAPNFNWLGNIIGGLMFGFGMVFAGGCATKNLVRAGSGDLRSLIVLIVMGIFAYMTIGGLFGLLRVNLLTPVSLDLTVFELESQNIGMIVSGITGLDESISGMLMLALFAGGMLVYCFKDADFRSSTTHVGSGIIIGICVVLGWVLTGLAFDEFGDPVIAPASLTFVRPAGDTLEYLMRFTAFGAPSFAVVTVVGTLIGAAIAAYFDGRLRLSTFADVKDTKRNLFGAALMGIGGVLALGCTVGQALTGISTLAVGSMLTFVTIVIGGFVGVHTLNKMLMAEV